MDDVAAVRLRPSPWGLLPWAPAVLGIGANAALHQSEILAGLLALSALVTGVHHLSAGITLTDRFLVVNAPMGRARSVAWSQVVAVTIDTGGSLAVWTADGRQVPGIRLANGLLGGRRLRRDAETIRRWWLDRLPPAWRPPAPPPSRQVLGQQAAGQQARPGWRDWARRAAPVALTAVGALSFLLGFVTLVWSGVGTELDTWAVADTVADTAADPGTGPGPGTGPAAGRPATATVRMPLRAGWCEVYIRTHPAAPIAPTATGAVVVTGPHGGRLPVDAAGPVPDITDRGGAHFVAVGDFDVPADGDHVLTLTGAAASSGQVAVYEQVHRSARQYLREEPHRALGAPAGALAGLASLLAVNVGATRWQAERLARRPHPPGWYPDQGAPGRLRFWDGREWTPAYLDPPAWVDSA